MESRLVIHCMERNTGEGEKMGLEVGREIRALADAALRKAASYGEPGSEEHVRAVVRECLFYAGIDSEKIPEVPMRDEIVSQAMGEAEDGLVLFEIEFVWAACRAMARSHAGWRIALVPPFHVHEHRRLMFALPGQEEEDIVSVRGKEADPEALRDILDAELLFAQTLAVALSGMSNKFVGMVRTADELNALAEGGPVGQVRMVTRSARDAYYDPVGELQADDTLWAAERGIGRRGTDVIAWQSDEVNGMGYDIGHLRGDYEHLSGFDDRNLREIIQLPEGEQTQLFVWDGRYTGPVEMTDMRDGSKKTTCVSTAELRYRLDYTPIHYSEENPPVRMKTVRSLVRNIQRGTKLNGKSLRVIGTTGESRPGAEFDFSTMTWHKEGDCYYVDNASLTDGRVKARVIAEIPAKQETYTLMPEDGTVVLVARSSGVSACYTPKCPTLVSNNLFIVWPDPEKATPEYLACALQGTVALGQMGSMRKPLGRGDLDSIIIPVGPKEFMDRVVNREAQIARERAELLYKLQLLSDEDPIDQLWATDELEGKPGGEDGQL